MTILQLYQAAQLEQNPAFQQRVGMAVTRVLVEILSENPPNPAMIAAANTIRQSSAVFVADATSVLAAQAETDVENGPSDEWVMGKVRAAFDLFVAAQ